MSEERALTPMTIRLSYEEHEFLRLLAAWWCTNGKTPRPDKVSALRKMLRMVKPPSEDTQLAKEMRAAYERMLKADE